MRSPTQQERPPENRIETSPDTSDDNKGRQPNGRILLSVALPGRLIDAIRLRQEHDGLPTRQSAIDELLAVGCAYYEHTRVLGETAFYRNPDGAECEIQILP